METQLRAFYGIRSLIEEANVERQPRRITGTLDVSPSNIVKLRNLQNEDYVEAEDINTGGIINFTTGSFGNQGTKVRVVLKPQKLHYYEDLNELLERTIEEPTVYFVRGHGELTPNTKAQGVIEEYREMLSAKKFLRQIADLGERDKVTFFAPEKLEIPFRCKADDLRPLPEIPKLYSELAEGAFERDQRIALFKKSLRDHLRMHPVEARFGLFLRNLHSIHDGYYRDFELWLGNTFADIKKAFEEKRLKFVSDLNAILNGIQASIIAVPLAALLVADKYDLANPLKNFFLSAAALGVAIIATHLLENQKHALDSTKAAIDAVALDYQKQQPAGNKEFVSRLKSIHDQELRVRRLLGLFKRSLQIIAGVTLLAWLVSFAGWLKLHH